VQATDTVPWPFRLSGSAYVTSAPTLVRAETVTGAGQLTSGASAMGGGAGVGALGVLHPAQQISTSRVRNALIVQPPWFFSSLVRSSLRHPFRRLKVNAIVVAPGRSMQARNSRECWVSMRPLISRILGLIQHIREARLKSSLAGATPSSKAKLPAYGLKHLQFQILECHVVMRDRGERSRCTFEMV